MRYMKLLSIRETFLPLLVELVLVNHFVLSECVLLLTQRRSLLLSFCLRRGSECEDVLSEITLLDKIFNILREGPSLRSFVSSAAMEGAVVLYSRMSLVV